MSTGIDNNEIVKVEPETTDLAAASTIDANAANQDLNQVVIEDVPSDPTSAEDWQRFQQDAKAFLRNLSQSTAKLFGENRSLLISLGWIVLALVSFKLLLAIVDAINDIPLLPSLLELVGIGYITWFIYRYMLNARSRQELSDQINQIKAEFLGPKGQQQLDQSLNQMQNQMQNQTQRMNAEQVEQEFTEDMNRLEETIEAELQTELGNDPETEAMMNRDPNLP
ncbi:hypothetical protein HJG54_31475 [Leptolyngbya sp. NK1-12]|uniref:Cyanobacterial aminoacyl-tRNA synthetase CAAD domain-containing protein n=1 Tax=Leptolyngbya sp. NK1-12 TaxID=2547451 RepID=A0AA97ALF5_9CYAN|nr:CAAD domain-containing protein [Leptolyngbya sp. NK1-12]WNZ27406.1 hypothetical protein HJG54_31475 [Leptolyngbya sp. NK1-12]